MQRIFWWKAGFSLKSVAVLSSIWFLRIKLCRTFGGKDRLGHQSCILLVRSISLKKKTVFLEKYDCFFFNLRIRSVKVLTFDDLFLCTPIKSAFHISRTPIWFFWTGFIPPSFPRSEHEKFGFSAKFLALLLKLHSTCTDELFEEKSTSWKNKVFHTSLRLRVEYNLTVDNLLLHCWQNWVFHRESTFLLYFFQQLPFFSPIPRFEGKNSLLSAYYFRHTSQNCILRVQTNVWWKNGFPFKTIISSSSLLVYKQKNVSEVCWKISLRPSKLHFICTRYHFEKKIKIFRKWFLFFRFGS